ncbi:lycopene cyclase domain-containing protein [Mucilaginibacter gracilis]|uniref:Lycopene cyclase domain-containing protein n=1 Tax=Mucilaginibacter gracilis TaxID=423350 RepID=A0A495IY68_9SPHI|nr:lycopene cyclase domain-containing protein [Mucilaginibacter gracilis]RKR81656.1 lycopene cyclase domain-containing protein [Mucilaginibacter gracilis]
MTHYAYLFINIATVFFPIVLSFDKRVAFYKSWKFIWPGMAITGFIFLAWDILFTLNGVWSFNPNYILGLSIAGLPLEEVLFFLTVPFACIFIYQCLNYYVKWKPADFIVGVMCSATVVYSLLNCCFNYHKLYTLVTFGTLAPLLIYIQFVLRAKWLNRFFMAYAVTLIPFYIVNGILTGVPIVLYNNAQNLGTRVGTIPLEDHFYLMALLLMNIAFFEYYRKGKAVN